MSTSPKSSLLVQADFDKEEAKKFLTPFVDFLKVSGTDKVSIRFNKNNTITIKAINDSKNLVTYIDYKEGGLPNLLVSQDCRAPIFELGQFIGLAKIFQNGFKLNLDEATKSLNLSCGDDSEESINMHCVYFISEEDVVNKSPEVIHFNKIAWANTFLWDSVKNSDYIRGISTMKETDLIIEGKKGENKIVISVTDTSMKTTTLKTSIKLPTENAENVKVIVNKQNFLNPITSSINKFDISISNRMIFLTGASDYHSICYYISPIAAKSE